MERPPSTFAIRDEGILNAVGSCFSNLSNVVGWDVGELWALSPSGLSLLHVHVEENNQLNQYIPLINEYHSGVLPNRASRSLCKRAMGSSRGFHWRCSDRILGHSNVPFRTAMAFHLPRDNINGDVFIVMFSLKYLEVTQPRLDFMFWIAHGACVAAFCNNEGIDLLLPPTEKGDVVHQNKLGRQKTPTLNKSIDDNDIPSCSSSTRVVASPRPTSATAALLFGMLDDDNDEESSAHRASQSTSAVNSTNIIGVNSTNVVPPLPLFRARTPPAATDSADAADFATDADDEGVFYIATGTGRPGRVIDTTGDHGERVVLSASARLSFSDAASDEDDCFSRDESRATSRRPSNNEVEMMVGSIAEREANDEVSGNNVVNVSPARESTMGYENIVNIVSTTTAAAEAVTGGEEPPAVVVSSLNNPANVPATGAAAEVGFQQSPSEKKKTLPLHLSLSYSRGNSGRVIEDFEDDPFPPDHRNSSSSNDNDNDNGASMAAMAAAAAMIPNNNHDFDYGYESCSAGDSHAHHHHHHPGTDISHCKGGSGNNSSGNGSGSGRRPLLASSRSESHPVDLHKLNLSLRDGTSHNREEFSFDIDKLRSDVPRKRIPLNVDLSDMVNLKYLTHGSNSHIYEAIWENRPVVIKVIQEAKLEDIVAIHEFDVEFELLSRIEHPNVVSVLGCGTAPRPFIVLERLKCVANLLDIDNNNSLPSLFRKRVFSYTEILNLAKSLADALHYLHFDMHPGATLIHRDLKPENIGLSADGTLKLFDFGLSRCIKTHADVDDKFEMTGSTGSLRFMAPEVALNQKYNEKVDVYSYAIVIWTLARNKMAFRGLNRQMHQNLVIIGGERPKLERNWPRDFSALLERCWHADSTKRPSFSEVSSLLLGMIDKTPASPSSGTISRQHRPPSILSSATSSGGMSSGQTAAATAATAVNAVAGGSPAPPARRSSSMTFISMFRQKPSSNANNG